MFFVSTQQLTCPEVKAARRAGTRVRRPLQIAISALLLTVLLVFVVDMRETWSTLRLLDVRWALLALLFLTADRILMTYKWLLLLALRGYRFSLLDATRLYCSAMMWGLALPSTVGADAVRTLMLRKRGVNVTDALCSIVIERGIGFLAALALALVSLFVLQWTWPQAAHYWYLFVIGAAALASGALLLAFSFSGRAFELLESMVPSRWRQSGVLRKLKHFHEAYRSLGTRPSTIAIFTVLTILEQLIAVPFTWAVANALSMEVSLAVLVSAMPLALLLARLPVSFDGIGIFEGIFIAVMSYAGIRPGQSLAIAIASRVLQIIALLPWWVANGLRADDRPAATLLEGPAPDAEHATSVTKR